MTTRRLVPVALPALAAAAVCAGSAVPGATAAGGAHAQAAATAEALPYSPATAVRRPLPARPRLDPRSGAIVRRLVQNLNETKAHITTEGEVPTVYRVTPRDPFMRVNVGGRDVRFRVPRHAVPGSGTDHPMVLLDRAHPDLGPFVELRLYRASIDRGSGRLYAGGAGLFRYDARGRGTPFLGAGTGGGLSIMAGLIRPREVVRGRIDHAVRFAYSQIDFIPGWRSPAVKSDQPRGYTRDPAGAMQMGMRLQLDPRVRCDRRTVPGRADTSRQTRFLRILCRALQTHGMIVLDGTSTGNVLFQMENEGTASWRRIIGDTHNGSYGYIVRHRGTPGDGLARNATSGIPWGRMRVLA
jgi:hypothetical protein